MDLVNELSLVHSALDDAIGDTDATHIEDDDELREQYPVQWAAEHLAGIIAYLKAEKS
jgi:hypothetical protein